MAKKNIVQRWIKRNFGNKFNIWDVVLLALIIGSVWYLYNLYGIQGFYEELATGIFYAVIIGFIVNRVRTKARR